MKRILLLFVLIPLAFFAFSCSDDDSEENVPEAKTNCNSNVDCTRDSYCDLEHPQQDEALGTLVYFCKKRTVCASQADCPMGWKCMESEHFCITEKEAESSDLWCRSDSDCTDPNYPKCNLGSGQCINPDGDPSDQTDSGDSGLPDNGDSGLPDPGNDADTNDDSDNSDSGSADQDPDTGTDTGSTDDVPLGETLMSDDFEDGGKSWTIEPASAESPCWKFGTPTSGPGEAHGGEIVAATNLEGLYPDNCKDVLFYNDEWTIPPAGKPQISFYAYVDLVGTPYSSYDYVEVLVKKTDEVWGTLTGGLYLSAETPSPNDALDNKKTKITQQMGTNYYRFSGDLSAYKGEKIQIGFRFVSDGSDAASGFYLDDVEITY